MRSDESDYTYSYTSDHSPGVATPPGSRRAAAPAPPSMERFNTARRTMAPTDCVTTWRHKVGHFMGIMLFGSVPLYHVLLFVLFELACVFWLVNRALIKADPALGRAAASVALVHFGAVAIPSTRRSVMRYLFRVPFTAAVNIHRWLAYALLAYLTFHGAAMTVSFGGDVLSYETIGGAHPPLQGLLAYGVFVVVGLTSLPWVRRAKFQLFLHSHLLNIFGLVLAVLHARFLVVWMLPAFLLYVADRIIRFVKSRKDYRISSAVRVGTFVRLEIEASRPANAAEYSFVRLPDVSKIQWHPFSPFSTTANTFSICFQVAGPGSWTEHAAKLAPCGKLGRINIDGPHGLPLSIAGHAAAVLVGSGIGVTPLLSTALSALRNPSVRAPILFLWVLRSSALLKLLVNELQMLADDPRFSVRIFFTGEISNLGQQPLSFHCGRPNVKKEVAKFMNEVLPENMLSLPVFGLGCGRHALVAGVKTAVKETAKKNMTISWHEEVFGL